MAVDIQLYNPPEPTDSVKPGDIVEFGPGRIGYLRIVTTGVNPVGLPKEAKQVVWLNPDNRSAIDEDVKCSGLEDCAKKDGNYIVLGVIKGDNDQLALDGEDRAIANRAIRNMHENLTDRLRKRLLFDYGLVQKGIYRKLSPKGIERKRKRLGFDDNPWIKRNNGSINSLTDILYSLD